MSPATSIREALFVLLASFFLGVCVSVDTITITSPVQDNYTVISSKETFRLGFFSPANSSNRYVGIMFNVPGETTLWVANRDRPLKDSAGVLTISEYGNLVILDGQKEIIWSSNVSNSAVSNSSAQLLDTGNLVLTDNSNGRVLWESFQIPGDSLVPKMKLSASANHKIQLTSWKSPSDPSVGSFTAGLNLFQLLQFFIWENEKPYWRSGPWDGNRFIGVAGSHYQNRLDMVEDSSGYAYFIFNSINNPTLFYYKLNSSGQLQTRKALANGDWNVTWSSQKSECDVYGKCGPFGSCNPHNSPICSCLPGFVPRDGEEWKRGNWDGGCTRKELLQCERNQSDVPQAKQDGYQTLSNIKVPDFAYLIAVTEAECRAYCLKNCSCAAFAYYNGIGCMHWSGSLIDVQQFSYDGTDLHIRLAYSELYNHGKRRDMKSIIATSVTIACLLLVFSAYICWKQLANHTGQLVDYPFSSSLNREKLEEQPLYTYATLCKATNNFESGNLLGTGGFGQVYKGKLVDGQEIAVKRLSKSSGQGTVEFMNEVIVISKLQHRNLVRLLGCSIERDEKMLVYEYLPKKSLDVYLFGSSKSNLLD